jgi:NUMOD4 motif
VTMTSVETWKSMREIGFSSYEASTDGRWRSLDRKVGNRRLKGRVLATSVSNRGYVLVKLTDDNGKQVTRTAHSLQLRTFDGPCPPGMVGRHLNDDPLDNRWAPGATREERMANGGNLMYGYPPENEADKVANGNRAAPRPPKLCVRCQAPFAGNGRRCHACVVWIGETAAELLSSGTTLAAACERLEYPSADGLHNLAVRYGGYGLRPVPGRGSWLQRVTATLRDWLELGDGE